MLINIQNQLTQQEGLQQTYLSGTIGPGATSAPIDNPAGFNANWAVQLQQTGEENAEIMVLNGAPTGTTMSFGTAASNYGGTVLYNHPVDAPIYQIHYDQIVLYRSTAGTGGAFSALGTYNITPDNPYTQINDATGASGYAYYAQYYNSVSGDLSGSSSVFIPGGPTYYSLQKLRQRSKDKLYSAGFIKDDTVITDWLNEWYEIMQNAAVKVNENYMLGSQIFGFGTNGLGTITDASYKQLVKLEISWDGQNFFPSTQQDFSDYSDQDYFDMYNPRHAWRGENVFEVLPHFSAGTVNAYYATRFTPLVNDSDELTLTLKAYTTSAIEYCLSVAYGLDQKDAESQQHYQMFTQMKTDFVAEVTPRDVSSVKMINILDNPSAIQEDLQSDFGEIW